MFRGNVIPKEKYSSSNIYPVYPSSISNEGLMGFWKDYMFDEELISWSIDGGGNFFYRKKHKFNLTNVCGYIKLNNHIYDYYFTYEFLKFQHKFLKFNYSLKAHPSVIKNIYFVPNIELSQQLKYSFQLKKIFKIKNILKNKIYLLKIKKKYFINMMFN